MSGCEPWHATKRYSSAPARTHARTRALPTVTTKYHGLFAASQGPRPTVDIMVYGKDDTPEVNIRMYRTQSFLRLMQVYARRVDGPGGAWKDYRYLFNGTLFNVELPKLKPKPSSKPGTKPSPLALPEAQHPPLRAAAGERIAATQTPAELDMEDVDVIEVVEEQTGGGGAAAEGGACTYKPRPPLWLV